MIVHPTLAGWLNTHPERYDALVFDIDGVLIVDRRPVPGAGRMLESLDERQIPYGLLTNDGNHSEEEKAATLESCGIRIAAERIVSCGHPLACLAKEADLGGRRFFVMGDLGRPSYAERAGLLFTRDPERLSDCGGIIIGEENYAWEPAINGAVNFLRQHPDAPLIVPNPDEYYPAGDGGIHIGAGGVARFIQHVLRVYGIRIRPIYLGKPFRPIFEYNHHRLEAAAGRKLFRHRVLVVGDFLESDIRGARNFGYGSALVLTGVTRREMLEGKKIRPDLVIERLS